MTSLSDPQRLFDQVISVYEYAFDDVLYGNKGIDKWVSFYKEVIAQEPFKGDCEDVALTWGELAYRQYNLPKSNIRIVRGAIAGSVSRTINHAWLCIDWPSFGWLVFDISQRGPIPVEACKNYPIDYLQMDKPYVALSWHA